MGELGDAVLCGRAEGLVGLTFDDGYSEVLQHAVPVLKDHGFSATVFAVTGVLGGENVWDPPPRRKLMTEEDLQDLAACGFEVGSHTVSHVRLAALDPGQLRSEVQEEPAHARPCTRVGPTQFLLSVWIFGRVSCPCRRGRGLLLRMRSAAGTRPAHPLRDTAYRCRRAGPVPSLHRKAILEGTVTR